MCSACEIELNTVLVAIFTSPQLKKIYISNTYFEESCLKKPGNEINGSDSSYNLSNL